MSAGAVANPEDDEKLQAQTPQYSAQLGQFATMRPLQQPQQQLRPIAEPSNATGGGGGDTPIAPVIARRSPSTPASAPAPTVVPLTRRGPIPESLATTLNKDPYSSSDLLPTEDSPALPAMQRNSLPLKPRPTPHLPPSTSTAAPRPGDPSQYEVTSPEYGSDTPTLGQIGDKWYVIATGTPYNSKKSTTPSVRNYSLP